MIAVIDRSTHGGSEGDRGTKGTCAFHAYTRNSVARMKVAARKGAATTAEEALSDGMKGFRKVTLLA